MSDAKHTFWFDLENAPDVLFFEPITRRLQTAGHDVLHTARDYADVPALAERYGLAYEIVGSYGGKSMARKLLAGVTRSLQLGLWARKRGIDLAVGFGSRPLALTCRMMRIRNATVIDYEHVSVKQLGRFCDVFYIPDEVPTEYLADRQVPAAKVRHFTGLKEEVYTAGYAQKEDLIAKLGIDRNKVVAVIRPPATSAHYHDHTSEVICREILAAIAKNQDVHAIYLRRDRDATFDEFLEVDNIHLLPGPVDGMDMIAMADLVLSGGGTMIREAVAIGVPAYSFFTGRLGAVDEKLSGEGRLHLVRGPEDAGAIQFVKRDRHKASDREAPPVLDFFVNEFVRLAGA